MNPFNDARATGDSFVLIEPQPHPPVEVVRRRRLLDDFLKVDEVVLRVDGREQRRLTLERGDSVAVLVHRLDDDVVLLTRQLRHATLDNGPGWLVELPAGTMEPGELPEVCARREVLEEIGYQVGRLDLIANVYLSPGGSSERVYLYYAPVRVADRVTAGGGVATEGECIELVELPRSSIAAEIAERQVDDAKTLVALLWLTQRSD